MYPLKLFLAMLWATPWVLLAVVLALTFIGIPLAGLCWVIGCAPYQHIVKAEQIRRYNYKNRERALEGEGEVPWEM